ncbi:MAG: GHKL domain-containing protein [Lachnospiraceae bacterium]|nr:GHKL domain-containing protein [Lachnospiraceae bacterium]
MKGIDLKEIIVTVLLNYYSLAMVMVLLHCFFDEGIEWNKKKAHIVMGYYVIDAILTSGIEVSAWWMLLEYSMLLGFMLYGCKGRYIRRGVLCIYTYLVVSMIYSGVLMMGLFYFFPNNYSLEAVESIKYREYVILAVFMAFCYYRMKYQYLKKDVRIKFGRKVYLFLGGYTFFIIVMFMMLTLLRQDPEMEQGIQGILVAILMVFCLMVPFYLIKGQVSNYYQSTKEYQEIFLQEQLKTLERYKAAEEETRRIRHDMKNNLSCISMLLNEGKTHEASEYVEGLLQEISALSPKVVTGDEMLNCVFSAKLDWMQKENIVFEIDGVLDRGLDWKPIDICKVFANAIDNAIEACMKITDRDNRRIMVSLKRTKQYYSIEMKNTIADKKLCAPLLKNSSNTRYTTKTNKKFHGLGLSNMYRTVEKYGGMMKVDCQDNEFILNIVV